MPGTGDCSQLGRIQSYSSQRVVYLGVILVSTLFRASPSQLRVEKLCSTVQGDGYECDPFSFVFIFCGSGDSSLIQLNLECHLEWWIAVDRLQSGISLAQVNPSPRLLVRLLGHGVGSSSSGCDRFRLLVSGGSSSVNQRQGVACGGVRSSRIPTPSVQLYGASLCGHFHSSSLSPQTRGHKVSAPQRYCAEVSSLHWQVWRFSCLDLWVV